MLRITRNLRNIIQYQDIIPYIKEDKKILGRWSSPRDFRELEKKVYLANHDHCGPCGYQNPQYYEKEEKDKIYQKN